MRYPRVMLLSFCLLTGAAAAAYADNDTLDCRRKSLADAVKDAHDRDQTIRFTGVCAGPIVIRTDGLSLKGVGTAIIDGGVVMPSRSTVPVASRSPTSKSRTA